MRSSPGNALPFPRQFGPNFAQRLLSAAANLLFTPVPSPAPAAALNGVNITSAAGAPIAYTPKVTGKLKVTWDVSGLADTGARLVAFTLNIGGQTFVIDASPGGDAAHTIAASGVAVSTPLALNTPTTVAVGWVSNGGTWGPSNGQGSILIEELPL